MTDIYVVMCDNCFGKYIGIKFFLTKSEDNSWKYDKLCEICKKNTYNVFARCHIIQKSDDKYKLEIFEGSCDPYI